MTLYEQLTGCRPPKSRRNRYVVVLDYGHAWVVHGSARTLESARKLRRDLSQWPSDKIRILDREDES